MLAKLTSKNQLTLPKSVTDQLGPVQYFEVQLQAGQVLLTPVRIQRGDAVRAKLPELMDALHRRDRCTDRCAERIAPRISDGPEAECKLV